MPNKLCLYYCTKVNIFELGILLNKQSSYTLWLQTKVHLEKRLILLYMQNLSSSPCNFFLFCWINSCQACIHSIILQLIYLLVCTKKPIIGVTAIWCHNTPLPLLCSIYFCNMCLLSIMCIEIIIKRILLKWYYWLGKW